MGLNIISFVIGAGWLIVVLIGGPILALVLLDNYLLSSDNNQYWQYWNKRMVLSDYTMNISCLLIIVEYFIC